MEAIGKGIVFGLMVSVALGPVFFLLIDTSIQRGFKKALGFSLGALSSDIFLVIVLYAGTAKWLIHLIESPYLKFGGGLLFVLFGLAYILIRSRHPILKRKPGPQFLKGLVINTVNPAVPVFWFAVISMVTHEFQGSLFQAILFFSGTFITTGLLNLIKIIVAGKIRKFMNSTKIAILNLITGLVFIGFGLFMILKYIET